MTQIPTAVRTTFRPRGLRVDLTFAAPLEHPRAAAAIARTTLARLAPSLELERFDWPVAVVQLAPGRGRYAVFARYRFAAAAARAIPRTRTVHHEPKEEPATMTNDKQVDPLERALDRASRAIAITVAVLALMLGTVHTARWFARTHAAGDVASAR